MSGKRIAIVQSSYIPWKGYFDLIRAVDEFVLLDDVQFTRRDWRSRNQIKTQHGPAWLTVPVRSKGLFQQLIRDTCVSDASWSQKHWATLRASYARAPFFAAFENSIGDLYRAVATEQRLSMVNYRLIAGVCRILGIGTPITWSSDYIVSTDGRNARLIDICKQAGATHYLSGPSARGYVDTEMFANAGICVDFADYSGYAEYPQVYPPFTHHVSALDLIFSTGPDALGYMKRL
jgi:WbqC-like protein family